MPFGFFFYFLTSLCFLHKGSSFMNIIRLWVVFYYIGTIFNNLF